MAWTSQEIDALKRGEPAAIDRLYREHARQILGWVIRLGGPHLDSEDVAHDVFTVAVKRAGGFRGESSVTTWLFGITRNVVANARRRAALRNFFGLADVAEPPAPGHSPDEHVDLQRRRRLVQTALDKLSREHREIIVLMDLEGRSAPEAAEMLKLPVGTAYSRLHHARRRFADALTTLGIGPELADAAVPIVRGAR